MKGDHETGVYHEVPGGAELVSWFGRAPSFHDAEILSLHLRREGQDILRLHGWLTTGETGPDGYLGSTIMPW
jgi:hypothetical protein